MPLPHGSQAPPALWRRDSAQPRGSQSPMVGDWGGHWVCVVRAVPSCCLRVGPRAVLCKARFFNSVLSAFKYLHLALCT